MNGNELSTKIKINQSKLRSSITQLTSKRTALRGIGNGAVDYNVGQIIQLATECEKLIEELREDAVVASMKRGGFHEYETREVE